jgi:hypothetical protein
VSVVAAGDELGEESPNVDRTGNELGVDGPVGGEGGGEAWPAEDGMGLGPGKCSPA